MIYSKRFSHMFKCYSCGYTWSETIEQSSCPKCWGHNVQDETKAELQKDKYSER